MGDQDGAKLLDKRLPERIKLYEWCPTMDLLAVVNVKNTTTIQRLETKQCSWQKLCNIETTEGQDVTALTWRPDGMTISFSLTAKARCWPLAIAMVR